MRSEGTGEAHGFRKAGMRGGCIQCMLMEGDGCRTMTLFWLEMLCSVLNGSWEEGGPALGLAQGSEDRRSLLPKGKEESRGCGEGQYSPQVL